MAKIDLEGLTKFCQHPLMKDGKETIGNWTSGVVDISTSKEAAKRTILTRASENSIKDLFKKGVAIKSVRNDSYAKVYLCIPKEHPKTKKMDIASVFSIVFKRSNYPYVRESVKEFGFDLPETCNPTFWSSSFRLTFREAFTKPPLLIIMILNTYQKFN